MQIKDIIQYLETVAPLPYQESYDNSGLITGNQEMKVTAALICVDSIEKIVDEAMELKCNLIIAHHPILFNGIKQLTDNTYIERTLVKAIKNNIAIYALHTNLDNAFHGVSAKIAERLGLTNYYILSPKSHLLKKLYTFCPTDKAEEVREALFKAGAGHIGEYAECSFNVEGFGTFKGSDNTHPYVGKKNIQSKEKEVKIEIIFPAFKEQEIIQTLIKAHPYEEVAYDIVSLDNRFDKAGTGIIGELKEEQNALLFIKKIKKLLPAECIRYTELTGKKIKKVAICGGAGSFLLKEAIKQKADIFISSDFRYHQFFDAENKIIIADVGHYESEQVAKELIKELLNKKFPTFAVHLSKWNTNPINYL